MKVLYVDINAVYLNPSASLFPAMIKTAFPEADFYGPGYVSEEALKNGIERWVSTHGGYEVVIFGPNTAIYADEDQIAPSVKFLTKFTVNRLIPQSVFNYSVDVFRNAKSLDISVKIVSTINLDSYAIPASWVERMERDNLFLLGPNHDFHLQVNELPEYFLSERHFARMGYKLTDDFFNFLKKCPERILTATHYVCPTEFRFDCLESRPHAIAVPGVEYVRRKDALRELKMAGFNVASKWYFYAFKAAAKAKLPVFTRPWPQKNYQFLFQNTLSASRFVYTSRDASGIPLRKFFEIPAAGAVLACDPTNGFSELGYVDGVHYLRAEPKDLPEILRQYDGSDASQLIAWRGQQQTLELHSVAARAGQVRDCVDAIIRRRFFGARWSNGTYQIQTNA